MTSRQRPAASRADAGPGGDAGLFGPGSMTWRIHADPSMALSGFRALLLQAVHPLVMAGFTANSRYREDPWGRLQRTGEWVSTVTFGTTGQATAAGAQLRSLHSRLAPGVEPETGISYRVDDPELLLWVHCTEVESFLTTYRQCGGTISDAEADRYVDEMRRSAALVGLSATSVPRSVAEIDAYYESVRPQLHVTAEARRAARWGFVPPMPRWVAYATPARPAWATLVGLSAALLPRWARRLYGLPGWPATDLAAALSGRTLRRTMLALPGSPWRPPIQRAAFDRVAS